MACGPRRHLLGRVCTWCLGELRPPPPFPLPPPLPLPLLTYVVIRFDSHPPHPPPPCSGQALGTEHALRNRVRQAHPLAVRIALFSDCCCVGGGTLVPSLFPRVTVVFLFLSPSLPRLPLDPCHASLSGPAERKCVYMYMYMCVCVGGRRGTRETPFGDLSVFAGWSAVPALFVLVCLPQCCKQGEHGRGCRERYQVSCAYNLCWLGTGVNRLGRAMA